MAGAPSRRGRGSAAHREAVVSAAIRRGGAGFGTEAEPLAPIDAAPRGARGAERIGLQVGDDVRHEKFGEGVVIDIEGTGDKAEAIVRFPDVGEKRLLLSWAPLTKI
jgi:DNA helicase II / ATP-dependent DNA helicase PcrA